MAVHMDYEHCVAVTDFCSAYTSGLFFFIAWSQNEGVGISGWFSCTHAGLVLLCGCAILFHFVLLLLLMQDQPPLSV